MSKLRKKFSFPINVEEIFENGVIDLGWFSTHSDFINEVYISPAFMGVYSKDMNGPNTDLKYADHDQIYDFLKVLKKFDIKICVVFNDNDVNIGQALGALDKRDYRELIDIIVVPDSSWLWYNLPFEIKNTVINLPTYEEIEAGKYNDYDMVYIHDEIIHNHDLYLELKKKTGLKFGTVVNYGDCATHCQFKAKHYELVSRDAYDANLFCPTSRYGPVELLLKRNSLPPYLSEYLYYADVIDIYKLQGRNTTGTFISAVQIIEGVKNNKNVLTREYLSLSNKIGPINLIKWKNTVRNCGGDCPNCTICDEFLQYSKE